MKIEEESLRDGLITRMTNIRIYKNKIISDIKSVIRLICAIGLYYSGIIKLYRYIKKKSDNNKGVKILAYHDISDKSYINLQIPPEIFHRHIKYLIKNNYYIISLEEAINLLKDKTPIREDTIVITFDDGYKDMYSTVFPIVKQYRIPITIFITAGPVEERAPLFVDAIAYAIKKTSKKKMDLSSWNLKEYSIKTNFLKEKAMYEINEYAKSLGTKDKNRLLEFIFGRLEVDFNTEELRNIMLSWDEITEMSKDSISFGAHTVSHPVLSRITTNEVRDEILRSKDMIQRKLNKEIKTFAYPYGSSNDINEEVKKIIEQSGFSCACMLQAGINKGGDDLFLLKRYCVTNPITPKPLWIFSKAMFASQMSGILDSCYKKRVEKIKNEKSNTKKINILFMIDNFASRGGTERHLVNLVTHLNKDRFNSMVCFFEGRNGILQQPILKQGIPIIDLSLNRIYSFKAAIQAMRLAKIIRKNKIDIVQTYHFKSDTYGVFVSKLAGASKIISSRRDTGDLKKSRQVFLNKLMNTFISHYIMVCNTVGERFYRTEGIPKDKAVTIYNGVDLNRFNPDNAIYSQAIRKKLGLRENDFIVGTSAVFRPEKAYHIFFEGIERVIPIIKDLKMLVLGAGPTKGYFEDYCSKEPLKHIVKFMGYIEDIENYISLMDVFCLVPNKNEGFSNAILEAMAMGKPVIATDVGGNAEAVIHNETGFVIPPDDSEGLSEAILELYKNPALRIDMGRKARKRVVEAFPMEKMIKEHEKLYEEIFVEIK